MVNSQKIQYSLFSEVDLLHAAKEDLKIFTEASEDFQAVLQGKKPVYTKVNKDAPLPADGGTSYYLGAGYSLTILRSLSVFGSLHGYVYGPIITFDKEFSTGNTSTLSSTKFYSAHALNQLLNK